MTAAPDPLLALRRAWTIALHEGAVRLLRHAVASGELVLTDALRLCEMNITRSSAENLVTRLANAALLERIADQPVTYQPADLGVAVVNFIDERLGGAGVPPRPLIMLLDSGDRRAIERAGFELYGELRRAAFEIALVRRRVRRTRRSGEK